MVVMKFGGTSVKDAQAMRRVADIVSRAARHGRTPPLVVVSAMAKVTDQLVEAATQAACGAVDSDLESLVQALEERHADVALALASDGRSRGPAAVLDGDWRQAAILLHALRSRRELSPCLLDAVMAIGEIASSRLAAAALRAAGLPAVWIDARAVLVTDGQHGAARPDMAATRQRVCDEIKPHIANGRIPVLGGFIGSTRNGTITTLGRGGSDYSASILGAVLAADEIQIWTDVDGMLTADPRVVSGTRLVDNLSFVEASELASFGAKVLHPSTTAPAAEAGIPIRILNSYRPEVPGSLIVEAPPLSPTPVTALACRRDLAVLHVTPSHPLTARGVLPFVLEVLDRYATPVNVVAIAEDRASIVVDGTRHLAPILAGLEAFARVTHAPEMALLCAVGERLRMDPSLSEEILRTLLRYPLRVVAQGRSRRSVTVVLPAQYLAAAMTTVHDRFCMLRQEAAPV